MSSRPLWPLEEVDSRNLLHCKTCIFLTMHCETCIFHSAASQSIHFANTTVQVYHHKTCILITPHGNTCIFILYHHHEIAQHCNALLRSSIALPQIFQAVQHTMISVTVSALYNLNIHILLDCAKTHLIVVFFSIILA